MRSAADQERAAFSPLKSMPAALGAFLYGFPKAKFDVNTASAAGLTSNHFVSLSSTVAFPLRWRCAAY